MRTSELAAALILLATTSVAATAQTRATARGVATLNVPEILTFRVVDDSVEGEVQPVVLVTANRDWRLTVRVDGDEATVLGGPGRAQPLTLPERLLTRRHRADQQPARLELTLSPRR